MKNVVVEVHGRYAILMNNAGDFKQVKNKNYAVGQRVEEEKELKYKAGWTRWAATAVVAVFVLFGGVAYAYYTPYTDVSFDINPSIVLSTNIFDTIIGVEAMNGDAEQLLQKIELENCDMQTAMSRLVEALIAEGYLTSEQAAEIVVTTCSKDQTRQKIMLQDMINALNQETARYQVRANVQGECIGEELKIRARELGVSPGKLMLMEQYALSTGDPSSVNVNEWMNKSVKEIMEAIHQQQNNGNIPANGNQTQDGYTGGNLNENGYNGGEDNGQNAGETTQNGYTGGDKNENGYNGGDKNGNGSNSVEDSGDSNMVNDIVPTETPGNGNSAETGDSGPANQGGSSPGHGR